MREAWQDATNRASSAQELWTPSLLQHLNSCFAQIVRVSPDSPGNDRSIMHGSMERPALRRHGPSMEKPQCFSSGHAQSLLNEQLPTADRLQQKRLIVQHTHDTVQKACQAVLLPAISPANPAEAHCPLLQLHAAGADPH